jgi:hypothetical protein
MVLRSNVNVPCEHIAAPRGNVKHFALEARMECVEQIAGLGEISCEARVLGGQARGLAA